MKWLRRLLPNSVAANVHTWSRWDWSRGGEEWTPSPAWKTSFIDCVLARLVPVGSRVLEIGPGGGRWTEPLLARACHVTAVDVTPACLQACATRFAGRRNLTLLQNDGGDLSEIAAASVDRVWSFDVFVHLRIGAAARYITQLPRVLAPGGLAVIHHARRRDRAGWRSPVTGEQMRALAMGAGLEVAEILSDWDEGRASLRGGRDGPDLITVLLRR